MRPKGERLEPLGASDDKNEEIASRSDCTKCLALEDERDLLQTSLFALTTHFAQVQFRLRQVVDAPHEDREELLNSLEEFAFTDTNLMKNDVIGHDLVEAVENRRQQQKFLLGRLKLQLKELKSWDINCQLKVHLHFKEDLEKQLRTQIEDLERFIEYLKKSTRCVCKQSQKSFKTHLMQILERSFSFLQLFALLQFSSGSNCFTSKTEIIHWGDLRAKLELAIIDLKRMLHSREDPRKITFAVRKSLAATIKDLMEHGTKSCLVPILGYFSPPTTHGWDIILYYYHFRKGDEFNSSPLQMLSRSFNLEIAGVSPLNNQKNFLSVIENIISTHSPYKKSRDSHFKAFVCAALNAKRLVTWLNLIFHCDDVIKTFYYPWSYVATTKYEDALRSLDVLRRYTFDLPVDLEVRKYQIEDNFFI